MRHGLAAALQLLLIEASTAEAHVIRTGMHRTVLTVVVCSALGASLLTSARVDAQEVEGRANWNWTPYVGLAQRSPVGQEWGVTPDRSLLLVGVQLETVLLRIGNLRLRYASNVTPLAVLWHTPSPGSGEVARPRAMGAGLVPFGLALDYEHRTGARVFAQSGVGALWFNDVVPVDSASAFNVTIEWGGGVDVPIANGRALRVGYKFHHISNVYSAPQNPGVDGHLFYVGLRMRATAPR
jgi:opacity protein-like surface antigen